MPRILILVTATCLLVSGCNTTPETSGVRDVQLAGYTITVPDNVDIYQTMRPGSNHDGGIAQIAYGQDWVVYPRSIVVRVPEHRGTLRIYDPDTEGFKKKVIDDPLCHALLTPGCPMEGYFNGMHATETLGDAGGGHFYRRVDYDRCGNETPAGLVAYYHDASMKTRKIFDEILLSVRR